jgi:hypothetical protein
VAEDPYRSPARDEIGLALTHALSDFEGVVSALRSRGILPAGTTA